MPRKSEKLQEAEPGYTLPHPSEERALRMIVSTLDQLREVATYSGVEDVEGIINAAFRMCASLHYLQVRGELMEEPRTGRERKL